MRTPVSGGWSNPYRLVAKNLSYKLCQKESSKFILKDVNCEAKPGEITAIAGPSGAGKTTLLEILAGQITPSRFSGQVLINGHSMNTKHFRRISGFVTQDDALFPLLTVEETLMYSALLRLKNGQEEAKNRVRELIIELGLSRVSGSRINNISGGERRRVSIGVDLVHNPNIILIDEPTSGLDSGSAIHIITLLKSMVVNGGKTIILSIHQPGFRILEMIDRVILLSHGFVLHNGSLNFLEERLTFVGHQIPRHVNVLEFAIDVIQSSKNPNNPLFPEKKRIEENPRVTSYYEEEHPIYSNSRFEEVLILGKRFCKNVIRTKQLFLARIIQALVAGLVLGTIFMNVGHDHGRVGLEARSGFFAFSLTFLLSSTTEGLPIFLQERRILMRETSRGAYRVSSYVLSNTIIFLPFLLLVGLLYSTPVYFLVGLRKDFEAFLYFSLVIWTVVSVSNSFVACFSALVPDFIMGNSVISGFMGCFFLFSGYFISEKQIPRYWIFMHYLSLFKYPFECFMINEYGGEQGKVRCVEQIHGGDCILYGDGFLRQQGLKESQKWSNLCVLLGFIFGYRVFCFLILWYRCYRIRS